MKLEELKNHARQSLAKHNGRLFFVADSKSVSSQALVEVLKDWKKSVLIVVRTEEIARDFAEIYSTGGREFKVISSQSEFAEMLSKAGISAERAPEEAARFRDRNPAVILCAEDTSLLSQAEIDSPPAEEDSKENKKSQTAEERALKEDQEEIARSILAYPLCKDYSSAGTFLEQGEDDVYAPFCVTDFFAACGYGCVILDDIYTLLDFKKRTGQPDFAEYDRLNFLGNIYYANRAHSYRRLKKLVESAEQCMVLSDRVAAGNVAELYAALHLLYDDVDSNSVRQAICKVYPDYNEVCDSVYYNISACKEDDAILSKCLQYGEASAQKIPESIPVLKQYILGELQYMSTEEICLRAVDGMRRVKPDFPIDRIVKLFDSSENNDEIAKCFYHMFFCDTVKGELENSKQSAVELHLLGEERLTQIIRVFLKYGVLQTNEYDANRLHIVRIRCEADGYEQSVRALKAGENEGTISEEKPQEDIVYSVTAIEDDLTYRCLVIADLMQKNLLPSPILLIAEGNDLQPLKNRLSELFPSYDVTEDLHDLAAGKRFVISNARRLSETALAVSPASTVFYDFPIDPERVLRLFTNLYSRKDAQVYMLVHHGDLSEALAETWREALLKSATVPLGFSRLPVKEEDVLNYSDMLVNLNNIYQFIHLARVSEWWENGNTGVAGKFNRAIADYTSDPPPVSDTTELELLFFLETSESYGRIFRNCVTVGGSGERSVSEQRKYVPVDKNKKKKKKKKGALCEQVVVNERERRVLFNVCSRMLFRRCDQSRNECYGCDKYNALRCNDFAAFEEGVGTFFTTVERFTEDLRTIYDQRLSDVRIIGGAAVDRTYGLPECQMVRSYAGQARRALDRINNIRASREGMFSVPYSEVLVIQQAAQAVYSEYLKKYAGRVIGIYDDISGKAVERWAQTVRAYKATQGK